VNDGRRRWQRGWQHGSRWRTEPDVEISDGIDIRMTRNRLGWFVELNYLSVDCSFLWAFKYRSYLLIAIETERDTPDNVICRSRLSCLQMASAKTKNQKCSKTIRKPHDLKYKLDDFDMILTKAIPDTGRPRCRSITVQIEEGARGFYPRFMVSIPLKWLQLASRLLMVQASASEGLHNKLILSAVYKFINEVP